MFFLALWLSGSLLLAVLWALIGWVLGRRHQDADVPSSAAQELAPWAPSGLSPRAPRNGAMRERGEAA